MTIKTGCSSALICLHTACQALLNGDCSAAIVGGTSLIIHPGMTIAMSEQGMLSPTGSCNSFDASANGYARADAINAIYIKPLSAALKNGDPVRAVIRATATNSDGRTPGITFPNCASQVAMIRRAYEVAGIPDISQTAFVECHGPGTPVGDVVEGKAIAQVFGEKGVYIGSVRDSIQGSVNPD